MNTTKKLLVFIERINIYPAPLHINRYHLALLTCMLLLAILLQLQPIRDVDMFTHISLGKRILQEHTVSPTEIFVYSREGTDSPSLNWLANVFFALLYQIGNWHLVKAAYSVIFALSFGIAGYGCLHRKDPTPGLFSVTAAVVLGILVSLSDSAIRPQGIAFLCFAWLLHCLNSEQHPKRIFILIPLLLLWQNCHASLITGALAAAAVAAGNILSFLNRQKNLATVLYPSMAFFLCILLQFATPLGTDIMSISKANLEISRSLLGVSEWLPPWDSSIRTAASAYLLALAISLVCLMTLRRKISASDLFQFFAFTILSLYAARFAVLWALVMIPIWSSWFERIKPKHLFAWTGTDNVSRTSFFRFSLMLIVPVLAVLFYAAPVKYDSEIPTQGIASLKQNLEYGRIYNYREWSGPILLSNFGKWSVVIDGRLYLYTRDEWNDYKAAAAGETAVSEIIRKQSPQAFFLRNSYQSGLIKRLAESKSWANVYQDELCTVFMHKDH